MTCPGCSTINPRESLYCTHCGEPLTVTALARQRSKELREKKTREIELTEAVAGRLMKWTRLLGGAAGALLVIFGFLLGKSYLEMRSAVEGGKAQIATAVQTGASDIQASIGAAKRDIADAQKDIPGVAHDVQNLRTDVAKYEKVDQQINKLQTDLMRLQNDVVDLGHKTLRVEKIQTTGPGPGFISFGQTGCSAEKAVGSPISYCAQGSPVELNTMTPDGRARPVASFSDIGFQDVSTAPKPQCDSGRRGTIYIQKGQPDLPFLCIKGANDMYRWFLISTSN